MPATSRSSRVLVSNAVKALRLAVTVYNSADSPYKEEAFVILLVNAWELLLKAKIVTDSPDGVRGIYVYEDGRIKLSRGQLPMTISVTTAIDRLLGVSSGEVQALFANLKALIKLRDAATHFVMAQRRDLAYLLHINELGAAAISNFLRALELWFAKDISSRFCMILPLAIHTTQPPKRLVGKATFRRFFDHLDAAGPSQSDGGFVYRQIVSIQVATVPKGSGPTPIVLSSAPDAKPVCVGEEEIHKLYPYTYAKLLQRVRQVAPMKHGHALNAEIAKLKPDLKFAYPRRAHPAGPVVCYLYSSQALVTLIAYCKKRYALPSLPGSPVPV
jgi:Protein of unknown function (DUF3644)